MGPREFAVRNCIRDLDTLLAANIKCPPTEAKATKVRYVSPPSYWKAA